MCNHYGTGWNTLYMSNGTGRIVTHRLPYTLGEKVGFNMYTNQFSEHWKLYYPGGCKTKLNQAQFKPDCLFILKSLNSEKKI